MADGVTDRTATPTPQHALSGVSAAELSAYQQAVREHAAWAQLDAFGQRLLASPLNARALRIFMASSAEFFREIPGGILALALRVTDEQMGHNRFGAVRAGASVLTSAVDEYGLGQGDMPGRTHHELFEAMVLKLGITPDELEDPAYIVPAARQLAAVTAENYRSAPVAAAAGFHFASEITSDHEFRLCFDGMAAHAAAYGMTDSPPQQAFAFYFVHTVVEPEHGASSERALAHYDQCATGKAAILAGSNAFLDAYGAFWSELNAAVAD